MNEEVVIQIRNALLWGLIFPRDRVDVGYESGWVTLNGVALHAYQKRAAEADARRVREVILWSIRPRSVIVNDSQPLKKTACQSLVPERQRAQTDRSLKVVKANSS
jgi:hypothetical protein